MAVLREVRGGAVRDGDVIAQSALPHAVIRVFEYLPAAFGVAIVVP
jgi:hypothetical protein